jgi:hypothetical protein
MAFSAPKTCCFSSLSRERTGELAMSESSLGRAIGLAWPVGTIDIYRRTSANPNPRAVFPARAC